MEQKYICKKCKEEVDMTWGNGICAMCLSKEYMQKYDVEIRTQSIEERITWLEEKVEELLNATYQMRKK